MASVRNRSSPAADVVKPFYFQDILEQEKPVNENGDTASIKCSLIALYATSKPIGQKIIITILLDINDL
jgi:hypothetical protein